MNKVIVLCNQKGGVAKTTTTISLGAALAKQGKKVLLIDNDPQGSLTISLGGEPDQCEVTLSTLFEKVVSGTEIEKGEGIVRHQEGMDYIPSNIELSGMEVSLVNVISRETVLRRYIETVREDYDHILLDCNPSLGMLTINALAAADGCIIPVEAQFLSAKGMEQLLRTVQLVRRQINPRLKIEGVLLTKAQKGANHPKQIIRVIRDNYGEGLRIFDTIIPMSVRAAEATATGQSVLQYDPSGTVAAAYNLFAEEVTRDEQNITGN